MDTQWLNSLTKTVELRVKFYPNNFHLMKDFYLNVLGFPIVESWDLGVDKGVMFNAGTAVLEIMTPRIGFTPPIQGVGLSLKVEDVWSLWERLKDHPNIVKPLGEPSKWGDSGFRITDPEGTPITFFTSGAKSEHSNPPSSHSS